MSARPLGATTYSWLSAASPVTRAHRYTTTSRQFKVGRELSGLRKAVTLQLPLLEVALNDNDPDVRKLARWASERIAQATAEA